MMLLDQNDRAFRFAEKFGIAILTISLLIGLVFRLYMYLLNRSLWYDAAALANSIVQYSYAELFGPLLFNQSAPVGFLLMSKLVGSMFDYSELALTFMPLVFGIAALVLFLYLSVEMLGIIAAPLAFVPFAFCSSAVYYSGEFKQYSSDLFFSILLLWVAHRIISTNYQRKWLIAFCVVGIISVWFSLVSIVVTAGTGLAIYINAKKTQNVRLVGLLILLHFAILYLVQIHPATPIFMFDYWANYFAQLSPSWWYSTIVGYPAFPLGLHGYGIWLALLAFAFGLYAAYKSDKAIANLLFLPFVVLAILSMLKIYPIATGESVLLSRLVLFSVPMAFLIIAFGIKGASNFYSKPLPIIGTLGLLLSYSALSTMIPFPMVIQQEMKPLVANLMERVSSGDSIYVYRRSVPAFTFYTRNDQVHFYSGNELMPRFLPKDLDKFFQSPRGRVWAVASHAESETIEIIKQKLELRNNPVQVFQWPGAWLFLSEPEFNFEAIGSEN